jgi:hypothetical protein
MASKVAVISGILKGSHVMGDTPQLGLAAYHDAKACVNAMRRVGWDRRMNMIRKHTKNYRVMVALTDGGIRLFRPDTKQEIVLSV